MFFVSFSLFLVSRAFYLTKERTYARFADSLVFLFLVGLPAGGRNNGGKIMGSDDSNDDLITFGSELSHNPSWTSNCPASTFNLSRTK